MKIGILTHPLRLNCGGIMQNYALSTVLRRMGHEVLTIDRHLDKNGLYVMASWFSRLFRRYIMRKNVSTKFNMMHTRKSYLKSALYEDFINANIPRTSYVSCDEKLNVVNDWGFDAIVVGSDQVWLRMYIPGTFLSFLKNDDVLKVAYAASFGKDKLDYTEDELKECSALAKKFNAISVREKSAVTICKEKLGVESVHVLDPTLLLTKEDYNQLCNKIPVTQEPILFVYILDITPWKQELISKIAEEKQLKVVDFMRSEDKSIEKWLSLFRDSSFVLTDSFHGTAFSIIYNKQFLTIDNSTRGNTRFTSLFDDLDLNSRLIHDNSNIDKCAYGEEIQYDVVNETLKKRINESKEFLNQSLTK